MARRFAGVGYFADGAELFRAPGRCASNGEIARLVEEVISKVPGRAGDGRPDAHRRLGRRERRRRHAPGHHRVLLGGRITWLYRAQPGGEGRRGLVCRPGGAPKRATRTQATWWTTWRSMHGPVLGLYGGATAGSWIDTVDKMKAMR